MRTRPDCAVCLLRRGINQLDLAKADPSTKRRGVELILKMLAEEYGAESIPANIGTLRDRIVKRVTGVQDPYKELKDYSNHVAMKLEGFLDQRVQGITREEDRFREACLIAIVGNTIEFDVMGYTPDLDGLKNLIDKSHEELVLDDIHEIYGLVKKAKQILYLTDNCGEIVFDKILVRELQRLRVKVTVGVKGAPVLNDATREDAEHVSLATLADRLITTGTDYVGVNMAEASEEFKEAVGAADLVVAKGMGNWENLPEHHLPVPVAHLLRTKCAPVAASLGVKLHGNVAKLLRPGNPYDIHEERVIAK